MRIKIEDHEFTAVAHNNMGYEVTMLMRDWSDDEWRWWAFQVKRIGIQGKITPALAQWADDNSTGMVNKL